MEPFLDKLRYIFDPSKKITVKAALVSVIVISVAGNLIIGAAGNYVYDLYKNTIHPFLLMNLKFNLYGLIFMVLIIAILLLYIIILLRRQQKRLLGLREINDFSDLLGEHRATLYWNMLSEINRICQEALDDKVNHRVEDVIGKIFKTIFFHLDVKFFQGGAIILPDDKDQDILRFWFMSPDQPLSPKQFNIGKTEKEDFPRGTAGKVFLSKKPHIVRIIDRENGLADDSSFHNFRLDRSITPYASFIALPIIWNDKSIGVLSIESQKKDGFSREDTPYLEEIAKAIAGFLENFGFSK